ncbi:MAG TPA: beta-ketoacyl synthase N-terminal-like domain-containing protein, partial [bacterium]|nr:beta-ketoacyl synthase N-terminal-like domain-containing protein [bacterium]
MYKRVVITGMGVITPVGSTLRDFWGALLAGKSGIGLLDRFDTTNFSSKIAAQIKGFDPTQFIPEKEMTRIDPFVQYALGASQMALDDSGLDLSKVDPDNVGVLVGSGIGGLKTI